MKKPPKSADGAPPKPAELTPREHTDLFASAMKAFTAGDYRKAREMFAEASAGPVLSVNESARMYARMCEQRLARQAPVLKSPEDHYHYAISLMNAGEYRAALPHLEAALKGGESGDVLYALALATGLLGDINSSAAHLRRACQIDQSIRVLARNDADFHSLLQHRAVREVLDGEKS
jgi:tetratricopeptide (TPR) repeat protein